MGVLGRKFHMPKCERREVEALKFEWLGVPLGVQK